MSDNPTSTTDALAHADVAAVLDGLIWPDLER